MIRLFLSFLFISLARSDLIVELPDGTISGTQVTTEYYSFNAYRGIPFAKPPLGSLRFQGPVPNDPWNGTLDATEVKSCCIDLFGSGSQSEDCLYLNVYTPSRNFTEKLPVMFWIYGGGFTSGCATETTFGPFPLVNEDVIVVTSNYRLGVYGFLSTQDDAVLGNAAFKDQLLAMKWTNKNIEYFGGDPEKVTIFGQSAGGMSVGAHLANKKSAGLYRAAICQSGCSLSHFIMTTQPDPRKGAYDIAKAIDPTITDQNTTYEIRDFLQSQSTDVINKAFTANPSTGPVIEADNEDAYVTEYSFDNIASGNFNQVPTIIGTTSAESLTYLALPQLVQAVAIFYDLDNAVLLPSNLTPQPGANVQEIANKIKLAYTGGGSFLFNLAAVVEYTSDNLFVRSSLKQAQLQSNYTPVYFYQFSFSGNIGLLHTKIPGTGSVGHAEDIVYLFNSTLPLSTADEFQTRNRLVRLWANFAKTLDPTPDESDPLINLKWPQVSGSFIPYLDIDKDLEVKLGKKVIEMAVWNDVYYNYGEQPFVGF